MEQKPFADESLNNEEQEAVIGTVKPSIFWTVMLVALALLGGMIVLISKGALAITVAVPIPVTLKAASIKTTNLRLYPGITPVDTSSPAVNQLDGTLSDLVISKAIALPIIGNVTVTLNAGQNTPVTTTGLTTDLSVLSSDVATFEGQAIFNNANDNAFGSDTQTMTLNNVTISAPYVIANSMTLPGLTLSITFQRGGRQLAQTPLHYLQTRRYTRSHTSLAFLGAFHLFDRAYR
ncbi:DUF6230 family protein [Ktedonobacter robiniae]|nr:DUF6230 family protein [Ktedonobacter robiniae]